MAMRFTTVDQGIPFSKIGVYGSSGMGKSVLCATMPTPVMISAENGTLSLRKTNLERLFGVGNPTITYNMPVIEITCLADLEQAYAWVTQAAEAGQFQSICLDSLSEIAEVVLNTAKATSRDPRQAYGETQEKVEGIIRAFRNLHDKHVFMIFKQGTVTDGLTGANKYGPMMPGNKLGASIPYFYDYAFGYRLMRDAEGKETRVLQTKPCVQYEAKDRSGCLEMYELPHLGNIIMKCLSDN